MAKPKKPSGRKNRSRRRSRRVPGWREVAASFLDTFMSDGDFADGFGVGCEVSKGLFPGDEAIQKVVPERLLQAARTIVGDARAAVRAVMSGEDPVEAISRRHRSGVGDWLGKPGKN